MFGSLVADFVDWIRERDADSRGGVEIGTVGWENREEHFSKGEPDDDGHTYVMVTIYAGKALHKPIKPGVAQGYKLLCSLAQNIGKIPPKGTRVYVAIPAGMESAPGAACVFAVVGPGREVNDNLGAGHATLAASGGAARITTKEDGSIVLFTTSDNTKDGMSVYLKLKPDGLEFVAPWGRWRYDGTGWHVKTVAGAEIAMGSIGGLPSPLDVINTYARIKAAAVSMPCAVASMANPNSTPVRLADADALKVILLLIGGRLQVPFSPAEIAGVDLIFTNASASK